MTTTRPDDFRSLVEGRITTEQYLRKLNERVEERRDPKPAAQDEPHQAA